MTLSFNATGTVTDAINAAIKKFTDEPPWTPFNNFIKGIVTTPPWTVVNDHLKELNDRLPAKMLTSGALDQLQPYCGMAASYAGSRLTAGPGNVPTVPAGVPVILTALAPLPGASLPSVGSLAAGTIPLSSVVTFQWHVSIAQGDGTSIRPGAVDCRPGATLDDVGGAFECISGNLTSPILEIIPWPDPNHGSTDDGSTNNVNTPSTTVRKFSAYLDISIWWPGLNQATVVSTPPVFFGVQPWSEVLDGSVDTSKKVWTWKKSTPDPSKGQVYASQFFDGLFDLAVSETAPAAGKIVAATISRADFKPILPQTVSSIVQRDPNLKIQAGLDVGAVLNNFKNVGDLITGSHDSRSTGFDSALSVSQVLSNALSIPLAVAVNGTDLAKTIVPNSPITLPNMVSSPDASALAGIIPIGKLMTRIESKLDENHLSVADVTGVLRQGLSFLPVPVFANLAAGALQSGPTVTISISLKTDITVPGATKPLKLNYNIGSFDLRRPVIPIPQVALMFSAPLLGPGAQQIQDVLIVPDPVVRTLLGSTDALKGALGTLNQTIATLRNLVSVFPSITTSIPDFDNVANTVSLMIQQLSVAATNGKSLTLIGPYSQHKDFNPVEPDVISSELPVDRWWDPQERDDHSNMVSAFLYIGATGSHDYQMRMGIDNQKKPQGRMFMPPRSVRFMGESEVSDGVTFALMDNSLPRPVATDGWKDWNDHIRWVEWLPPSTKTN